MAQVVRLVVLEQVLEAAKALTRYVEGVHVRLCSPQLSTLPLLLSVRLLQLLFYSWWWIIIVPLALGYFEKDSVLKASLANGAGIFLLWFGMSLYEWKQGGEIIVARVVEVMGAGSGFTLAIATGIIGFGVASLAGYFGFSLRRSLVKEYQV